jgi:hypothetical protein
MMDFITTPSGEMNENFKVPTKPSHVVIHSTSVHKTPTSLTNPTNEQPYPQNPIKYKLRTLKEKWIFTIGLCNYCLATCVKC